MFLNLPRDVIRSTARFRLRVHTLRFETATWNQSNSPTCDLCDTDDVQDEQHDLYHCACIPTCWKQAELSPLYKKGPLLDPNNYRMLAVSGTMYRMYANVIRSLLTEWCGATGQIPDTQYSFYPDCNTLQPMFILWHLQHAAQTNKPNGSPRLHAAFIDFRQAYDTIPRDAL
jgi:hypothetical protein